MFNQPTETTDVAVAIVHAGLAKEIDWLRANGHHIPTWEERRADRIWRKNIETIRLETRYALSVMPPTSFVQIASVC